MKEKCPTCNGDGSVPDELVPLLYNECPKCHGEGTITNKQEEEKEDEA